jgi:hypothetical protein
LFPRKKKKDKQNSIYCGLLDSRVLKIAYWAQIYLVFQVFINPLRMKATRLSKRQGALPHFVWPELILGLNEVEGVPWLPLREPWSARALWKWHLRTKSLKVLISNFVCLDGFCENRLKYSKWYKITSVFLFWLNYCEYVPSPSSAIIKSTPNLSS